MAATVRYLLIAVAVAAIGLFAYQAFQHKIVRPADPLVDRLERICLSNTTTLDKAEFAALVKAVQKDVQTSASLGSTSSRTGGANAALSGAEQRAENDEVRRCIKDYLQTGTASGGGALR